MLLVEHIIKQNQYGLGCYSKQFIPKNTLVTKFDPRYDKVFNENDIINAPNAIKQYIIDRAYKCKFTGLYIIPIDGAQFVNHSNNPNVEATETGSYALKDIQPNEEITINYNTFETYLDDTNILFKLCHENNIDISYRK
jgi:SET domain-containing protein